MGISLSGTTRVVVLLALEAGPAAAADVEHGKVLFETCAACHSDRADALGPNLKGVFGRRSASLDDFRYSNPMKRANLVWDEDNLRAYIHGSASQGEGQPHALRRNERPQGRRRRHRLSQDAEIGAPHPRVPGAANAARQLTRANFCSERSSWSGFLPNNTGQ